MADLLASDERDWLLGEMRRLIELRGADTFLTAPILEPTPRCFPDPFQPNADGLRVLLGRVLVYAGLDELQVELDTFSQPAQVRELDEHGRARAWGHQGAAAWFAGIEDGRCQFGVAEQRIRQPETLVATLCHEVAHAWRTFHGLCVDDRDVEELLTDLSTVYLGFGVLTTNGAYVYRASGELTGGDSRGSIAVTQWSHSRVGYVPPEAMSFLLALQAKARGMRWLARRRLAARLEANQASLFRGAMRTLGSSEDVRARLGLLPAVPA